MSKKLPKVVHVPRIGETVYVLSGISLKVKDVRYSSSDLNLIAIILDELDFTPELKLVFKKENKKSRRNPWEWIWSRE